MRKITEVLSFSKSNNLKFLLASILVFVFGGLFLSFNTFSASLEVDGSESRIGQATPPQIISHSPLQNELGVLVDTNIIVEFDVDIDESTINESTFVVNARSTGLNLGTFSYDSENYIVTFNPYSNFAEGEVVTVVLTTGIESSGGIPLEKAYAWSFTIKANGGPGSFFTIPSDYVVDDSLESVFAADLDGDGDLDLVTANYHSSNVSVLLNQGNATFSEPSNYSVDNIPRSVFAADLDGDGDLDLVTANTISDNVSVLLNEGDATFSEPSNYSVGSRPRSVFVADLDGDGDLDLATANTYSDNVSVLLNKGDATFFAPLYYSVDSLYPISVFAADLDGDADLDLVTANWSSNNVSVLLNEGDATFSEPSNYSFGVESYSIFAADLDGDGDLDLVTANSASGNVSVLLNQGNATFSGPSNYSVSGGPHSVFAADLDGDGDLDLAAANVHSDNVSVLLNEGNATFSEPSNYSVDDRSVSVFAADLDGDGDLDLVTANGGSNISVLLNEGGLVGYWKFDEGSGNIAYDSSGYGNNGTLMNEPDWVGGVSHKALEFDGTDDYVLIPDSLSLKPEQFTLEAWVNISVEQCPGRPGDWIFGKECNFQGYGLSIWGKEPVAVICDGMSYDLLSGIELSLNQWHFVASTYDGTTLKIYIDGELKNSIKHGFENTDEPLVIGAWHCTGYPVSRFLNGIIDEVKVYSRALSAEEIYSESCCDADGDGILDHSDNCPLIHNPGQENSDSDNVGDVCDNCWYVYNRAQADSNGDCPAPPYETDPMCGDACESCCVGLTGNVDGDPDDIVDIGDLTALIRYFFIDPGYPELECMEEANIDGDPDGIVDIGDLTALIQYLFVPPYPLPAPCPGYGGTGSISTLKKPTYTEGDLDEVIKLIQGVASEEEYEKVMKEIETIHPIQKDVPKKRLMPLVR